MLMWLLEWGLGFACLLFVIGYILAKKHVHPLHQRFAGAGVLATVLIGIGLIVLVQLVNKGDIAGVGIAPSAMATPALIIIHRVVATLIFVVMLYMAYAGIKRKVEVHRKIGLWFLLSNLAVYASGLALFTSTP